MPWNAVPATVLCTGCTADFRPSYLQLGELRALFKGLPVIACTATATSHVRKNIIGRLQHLQCVRNLLHFAAPALFSVHQ